MPAPTYIIGKVADPIFALFIGLSAAATRINREEKDKGRTTSETVNAGLRYACFLLVSLVAPHGNSYSDSAQENGSIQAYFINH